MMIIKYLTPVHIVFLTPIFYFLFKFVLIIYNIIYCSARNDFCKFFDNSKVHLLYEKFILDILGDIFSFFGFLIYLEIIELNCFGLNYNLRNKIIKRADSELMKIDDFKSSIEDENITSINSEESTENIINTSYNSNISY